MKLFLLTLSAVTLSVTLAQATAPAPATPETSAASHEESRKYFRAGNQAWIDGDKVAAQAHYKRALELEEAWDVACNLGRAEGELGLDAEALTHLDLCLKEYPPSKEKKVQEARAKFYDLRVEIRDRCRKMGCSYRDPAPASGLNEPVVPVAATATAQPEAKPEVSEPKEIPEAFAPPPEGKPKRASAKWPVVISTAAVGAVGVGLGGGFFVMSEGKKGEAMGLGESLRSEGLGCEGYEHPRCIEYASAKQSYFDLQTAGIVAMSIGGGLLLGAGVMALVWPEQRSSVANSLRPIVSLSDRSGYFGFSGSF